MKRVREDGPMVVPILTDMVTIFEELIRVGLFKVSPMPDNRRCVELSQDGIDYLDARADSQRKVLDDLRVVNKMDTKGEFKEMVKEAFRGDAAKIQLMNHIVDKLFTNEPPAPSANGNLPTHKK
jgi:hypothetical protein